MQHKNENWTLLRPGSALAADIHLLCEAPKPARGTPAIGQWRTVGLEDELPLNIKRTDRPWSTAVAAEAKPKYITDARVARGYKAQPRLPFKPSRSGSWTAAQVKVGHLSITGISLYGLLDEKSDASVHRSLSELAPIFDHPEYGRRVLLGGDFNIVANPRPDDPARARHLAVLTRLEAYGLVNCLDHAERSEAHLPLADCPCGDQPCRRHWRTYMKSNAARGTAYQEDYLMASAKMFSKFAGCEVLPFVQSSDHAPIRVTFSM